MRVEQLCEMGLFCIKKKTACFGPLLVLQLNFSRSLSDIKNMQVYVIVWEEVRFFVNSRTELL